MKPMTPKHRNEIDSMFISGFSQKDIAAKTGYSVVSVSRYLKESQAKKYMDIKNALLNQLKWRTWRQKLDKPLTPIQTQEVRDLSISLAIIEKQIEKLVKSINRVTS